MDSRYIPRVNQLDALQLDNDIYQILKGSLNKAIQNISPGFLSKFQPELDLFLRTVLWNYSVYTKLATFGQDMLSITYDKDQLTKTVLVFHYILTIILKYIKDNIGLRFTSNISIQQRTTQIDNTFNCLIFLNTFRFLKTGKKPTLVEYILGLDHISVVGNRRRNIGYLYMTRELLWTGFMELLGVTLPLINYHAMKRKVRNIFSKKLYLTDNVMSMRIKMTPTTLCVYCNQRVTLPHHMGCGHIFCYYCLKANREADIYFQCPVCDFCGDEMMAVIVM